MLRSDNWLLWILLTANVQQHNVKKKHQKSPTALHLSHTHTAFPPHFLSHKKGKRCCRLSAESQINEWVFMGKLLSIC